MFLNIQIDLLILKTYYGQFTLTTKKSLHIIFSLYFVWTEAIHWKIDSNDAQTYSEPFTDWLTKADVPLDKERVISETFFPTNLLACYWGNHIQNNKSQQNRNKII